MKLNCKVGDLAAVIRSRAGNEGKFVECVQFIGPQLYVPGDVHQSWIVDRELPAEGGLTTRIFADFQLRPIHDSPGQDETLTWCDVPSKVPA